MKIKLTYDMQKRFEESAKLLKRASKTGSIDEIKAMVTVMDMLHLLIDNIKDESDILQLEKSFEVLLELSTSAINK